MERGADMMKLRYLDIVPFAPRSIVRWSGVGPQARG
jgi:hypothetical protein